MPRGGAHIFSLSYPAAERKVLNVTLRMVFLAGLAQPVYHFAVQRNTLGLILPFGFGFRQSG